MRSEKLDYKGVNTIINKNLKKISVVYGGPALEEIIETENDIFNILVWEISVLAPKVCIFTSGPRYDKYIEKSFRV